MRRGEAVALLGVGLALIVAGLVWLFGPYGLLAGGAVLSLIVLVGVEVRDDRGEALGSAPGERVAHVRPGH